MFFLGGMCGILLVAIFAIMKEDGDDIQPRHRWPSGVARGSDIERGV